MEYTYECLRVSTSVYECVLVLKLVTLYYEFTAVKKTRNSVVLSFRLFSPDRFNMAEHYTIMEV